MVGFVGGANLMAGGTYSVVMCLNQILRGTEFISIFFNVVEQCTTCR